MKTAYDNYKYRAIVGESVDFRGYWITSRRFYHLPSTHQYGHDRRPEFNSEIQNIHTLFKKTFTVRDEKIKQAKLFITGDDLYKLYFNSEFIGEGPAQSYPFAYNYNCYDVTDLIKSGENAIGVHLYYQGLFNIYLVSADNLCGMILQLEITYTDGTCQVITSDRSWKYTECDAYTPKHLYGYQTQFSEDIDLGRIPCGWTDLGYDTDEWSYAQVQAKPYPPEYNLTPQLTPPVRHEKVYPEKISAIDNGYFFDFGKEITGTLAAFVKGERGDTVELRFGEELDSDGRVRFDIRANCVYADTLTLSGKEDFIDYFDYKGFRYAEILGVGADFDPKSVYTLCRHYPFPERIARFKSSDENLNKVWDICVQAVKVGTQDTYYDCPTREKGGFVGDALITGLSHLILTGDARIYKKFITDCKNSSRYCPPVMAHLPTYDINICADYSSLIPLFLEEYYNYTGDREFLSEMLPIAEGVWDYYSKFLNEEYLLCGIEHMEKVPKDMAAILVDWPVNLRDGYDMEKASAGVCTVINMFFYGFLKTMASLYRITADICKAEECENIYTAMGASLIKRAYNENSGLFRDTPESDHSAIHANALQMFFGLTPPKGYGPIVDMIMKRRLNCGVYFAYFVIKGLYNIGEDAAAYDLLSGKDEHSWYNMLKSGATTCMEAWGPDQKWNTSWCHPWSSSPVYFYVAEIMGIKGCVPGMKSIRISPKIPADINWIELEVPTPNGFVLASARRTERGIDYTVTAPDGVEVIFEGEGINFKRK